MTKTQNTILFLVLGTLANIVLTVLIIIILTVLAGLTLKENLGTVLPFIFILGVIGGMVIYQKSIKVIIKKYNLEEKMNPLFAPKKR